MTAEKIVTCCYCGTRAALILRGRDRHELTCSACGAPLHDLKMLRADHKGQRELVKPRPNHARAPARHDRPYRSYDDDYRKPKKRKGKRRKSFKRKFFEEAFDIIEDIFD